MIRISANLTDSKHEAPSRPPSGRALGGEGLAKNFRAGDIPALVLPTPPTIREVSLFPHPLSRFAFYSLLIIPHYSISISLSYSPADLRSGSPSTSTALFFAVALRSVGRRRPFGGSTATMVWTWDSLVEHIDYSCLFVVIWSVVNVLILVGGTFCRFILSSIAVSAVAIYVLGLACCDGVEF